MWIILFDQSDGPSLNFVPLLLFLFDVLLSYARLNGFAATELCSGSYKENAHL